MGRRIEDVTSSEFDALFTSFEHTAYRLETLQAYDVSYEVEPYQAFLAGYPQPRDLAKDQWISMIRDAVQAGKVFQRVHVVVEPLTDYLRYELGWSYPPNVDVGEDIRILPTKPGSWPSLPRHDPWLFDSRDLWVMEYAEDGAFRWIEQISDPAEIVRHAYWRDAALHVAVPYRDYMRRAQLAAAAPPAADGQSDGVQSPHPESGSDEAVDNRPDGVHLLHPEPGTGCNQRVGGVQPAQRRGAAVAPEPSREPSTEPSAASAHAGQVPATAGTAGDGQTAGEFFAVLDDGWRLTADQRARLAPAVQAALDAGWLPHALAASPARTPPGCVTRTRY